MKKEIFVILMAAALMSVAACGDMITAPSALPTGTPAASTTPSGTLHPAGSPVSILDRRPN